jgi:hypothetical protein
LQNNETARQKSVHDYVVNTLNSSSRVYEWNLFCRIHIFLYFLYVWISFNGFTIDSLENYQVFKRKKLPLFWELLEWVLKFILIHSHRISSLCRVSNLQ